jgi:hypothetical protein
MQSVLSALGAENQVLAAGFLHETVHYVNGHSCAQHATPDCLAPLGSLSAARLQGAEPWRARAWAPRGAAQALGSRAAVATRGTQPGDPEPQTGRPRGLPFRDGALQGFRLSDLPAEGLGHAIAGATTPRKVSSAHPRAAPFRVRVQR